MDFDKFASTSSVDKLKCTSCQNYLSHFPIWVCINNQNICGRCTAPEDELVFQNVAFETISQFLKFPCRYKSQGCDENLYPREVPAHEKNCPFGIIPCPVTKANGCEWEGLRADTLQHCHDQHHNMFINGEIVMNLTVCDESYHLIEHENLLLFFLTKLDLETKKLRFVAYLSQSHIQKSKFLSQLSVKCANKNLTVDFATGTYDQWDFEEVSLDSGAPTASLKIKIGEAIIDPNDVVNLDMLSVLKCFLCSQYSIPPIYHCVRTSDTLCSDCKNNHQSSCDSCQQDSASTRNISLDKMASLLNYPCKNHQNGCLHVGKPDDIKKHQSGCELGDLSCPISEFENCAWKGLSKTLENHIQNNHQELVTNSAQLSKQFLPGRMKCDIIKFCNQLFRLVTFKTNEGRYLWTVQIIGPHKENFKYEIEIVDPLKKGRRLLVRQQCAQFTRKEDIFKNGDGFCYFLKDQICDFVTGESVTFKVHIFI